MNGRCKTVVDIITTLVIENLLQFSERVTTSNSVFISNFAFISDESNILNAQVITITPHNKA